MQFELIPILSVMEELYETPRSPARFQEYLAKLQGGTKGDMALPIGGFNPMAKEHILEKIHELQALQAEELIGEVLVELNAKQHDTQATTIKVVLNLADDLKGGWTNHYTTDFDSKFKINALVVRNFCTPYFWTSEDYDPDSIKRKTLEYAYRTIYWKQNEKPKTLADHFAQEVFVQQQIPPTDTISATTDWSTLEELYQTFKDSDDYSLLFNFFYGDEASASLGYATFGVEERAGFRYASLVAEDK